MTEQEKWMQNFTVQGALKRFREAKIELMKNKEIRGITEEQRKALELISKSGLLTLEASKNMYSGVERYKNDTKLKD